MNIKQAIQTFTRFYSVKSNLKNNPIQEDAAAEEFRIKLNGDFARIEYKKLDHTTYDLRYTHLPPTYQGQGLGPILAERIFDHLIEKKSQMKVTCEFLQKFLNANRKKYTKYVVN